MNITTKRLKEIIMEEVKALSENAPEEEIEEGAGKLDDAQIMRDIEEMLKDKTLNLTDEQRNTLETILHHILGGRMGIDDKPSRVEPDPLTSLSMDHMGISTPSFEEGLTKKGLARIIREETVKALKEYEEESYNVGDFVQVTVSDDGYSTSLDKINPNEYENERSGAWAPSVKLLAKVIQVAERTYDEGVDKKLAKMRKKRADDERKKRLRDAEKSVDVRLPHKEGVVDMDGETIVTGPDDDASPEARGLARQDDLQATMMKAAMEIQKNQPQKAYETLLRALAAAGIEDEERLPGLGDAMEEGQYETGAERKKRENAREQKIQDLMKSQGLSRSAAEKFAGRSYSQTR